MMNAHSAMEINFSVRPFGCAAYTLLTIMLISFAKPLRKEAVKIGAWVVAGGVWLYLSVFGGLLIDHRMVGKKIAEFRPTSPEQMMSTFEKFIRRDVFDHEDL